MTPTITCSACSSTLTVTPWMPPTVTCPRCLIQLENPHAGRGQVTPMRVIPIERDMARDQRTGTLIMIVAAGLVLVGCVAMLERLDIGAATLALGLGIVLIIGLGIMWLGFRAGPVPTARATPPPLPRMPTDQGATPPILQYRAPPPGGIKLGMFFAGFFPAVIICAIGFLLLGFTVDFKPKESHVIFLLAALALPVIHLIVIMRLYRRPGWNGFGAGSATGLGIGMMALGPCAACYLITFG